MDFSNTRSELKRMGFKELLQIATKQKIRTCIMINNPCPFYFRYDSFNFCVSEILGEGCQVDRLDQFIGDRHQTNGETVFLPPFLHDLKEEQAFTRKKDLEFKVYWRDRTTRSITQLGTVTERRKKERGNNFADLLKRAINNFSYQVLDPSGIFLLGS